MPWHWIQPSVKSWLSPPPNLFPQRLSAHLVTNHSSQKRVSSALDIGGHGIFRRQSCQRSHQESQRPSVTARILTRKLNLLSKVSSEGESVGCRMYTSLTIADPLSLRLVQECLSLENKLDCHSETDLVLRVDNNFQGLWGIKMLILESDWKYCLSETSQHQSTSLAAKIATHTTWSKLWDMTLDHGTQGTAALQALYHTLTRTGYSQKSCPFCNNHSTESSHFEHYHLSYKFRVYIVELLIRESTDIFVHAKPFLHPVSS